MEEKYKNWLSYYALFLAALGLSAATHSRGENINSIMHYVHDDNLLAIQPVAEKNI